MKKKTGFSLKVCVAFLLALVMATAVPMQTVALAEQNKDIAEQADNLFTEMLDSPKLFNGVTTPNGDVYYISDLLVSAGNTYAEASSHLEKAGYTVFNQNINDGTEGSCVLLGYKLSKNRSEAITSIHTMEMQGGYQFKDYREFMEEHSASINAVASGFMDACKKLAELVKEGDTMAVYAYDTLNLLCVPEEADDRTGPGLGEYLLDSDRTLSEYKDLLMVCDTGTLSFINNLLASGCAQTYTAEEEYCETEYVTDPDWLTNAVEAAFAKLETLSQSELNSLNSSRKSDVSTFRKSLKELKDIDKNYLRRTAIEKEYSGETYHTLGDLLLDSSKYAPVACFIDVLPEGIDADNFASALSRFVADGTIPKTLAAMPLTTSPWLTALVKELNTSSDDPFDKTTAKTMVNGYGNKDDLLLLGDEIEQFIGEYRLQKAEFDAMAEEFDGSEEELLMAYTEDLRENYYTRKEEGKSTSDLIYYLGAYEILASYRLDPKSWLKMPDGTLCDNVGSYFELIADAENETTQNALISVLARNLSSVHLYNAKTVGMSLFILNAGVSPDNVDYFDEQYEENAETIHEAFAKAGYDEDECTIWYRSNRDLLDNNGLAFTSDTVRADAMRANLDLSFDVVQEQLDALDGISEAIEIIGIAGAAAGVVWAAAGLAMWLIGSSMTIGMMVKVGVGCIFGASCAVGVGIGATVAAFFGSLGFILTILTAIATIVLMIVSATYKIEDKTVLEYSDIPTIMLDCDLNANNEIIGAVRYDAVPDALTGEPADLNDMLNIGADRWIALYYSRSEAAGSPLQMNGDKAFTMQIGSMYPPERAKAVSKFGEKVAYNLNSYNKEADEGKTLFLFCYTENSMNGTDIIGKPGKYISSLRLSVAPTEGLAKDYLANLEGFYVLDQNLTPGSKYATYVGYSTTDSAQYAVTDIRFKTACTDRTIYWGDRGNPYICFYSDPQCPLRTSVSNSANKKIVYNTNYLFQPYYSVSKNVGDPILSESLRVFDYLPSGEYKDYYVASWFSGGAFDFKANAETDTACTEGHKFLGYLCERDTSDDSDEEYLAGLAFFSGLENSTTALGWKKISGYASELGYKLLTIDLAAGALVYRNGYKDRTQASKLPEFSYGKMYLAYITTKDPKRAITDIGVFTGEPKNDGSLPGSLTRGGIAFEAAQVFLQDHTYETNNIFRSLDYSNAFFGKVDEYSKWRKWFVNTDWSHYKNAGNGINPKPYTMKARGLYTTGPVAGAAPIRISDVLYGQQNASIPNSTYAQNNIELYSLAGSQKVTDASGGGWKTVHAMEDFMYDTYDKNGDLEKRGINLGLTTDGTDGGDCYLYLYYRNAYEKDGKVVVTNLAKRGKYIAKAEIVGSVDENCAYDTARIRGMAYGQEIVNLKNPLFTEKEERGDIFNEYLLYCPKDTTIKNYTDKCYYITVTYTDDASQAVSMIMLDYQDGKTELPDSFRTENKYRYLLKNDVKNKYTTYYKGASVAPIVPDPVPNEDGVTPKPETKYTKGYVLYCGTRLGGTAGRLQVLDNMKLTDPSLETAPHWFAETRDEKIFSTDGKMGQSIVLYGYEEKYVFDIMTMRITKEMTKEDAQLELAQLGYTQMIYLDALNGTSISPVYIGIMRTDNAAQALQDIRVVHENLKEEADIDYWYYDRVNDISLTANSENTNADPVFIYVSKGDYRFVRKFAERTAITNVGIAFSVNPGEVATRYYWNGRPTENDKPTGFTEDTEILSVMDLEYDDQFAFMNEGLLEDEIGRKVAAGGNDAANEYRRTHGLTWLVFTTESGIPYIEYEDYYLEGLVTGNKEGDEELGIGSVISKYPSLATAVGILAVIALLVGATLLIGKRKKKKSDGTEEE